MYFNNLESLLSIIYPKLLWRGKGEENNIYLSFDDGPIPIATEYVLDTLQKYNAKATFFCVGDNIRKHPNIYSKIINAGHKVGNHTFNHLKGWNNSLADYISNVALCDAQILKSGGSLEQYLHEGTNKKLFRPPYGKITKEQIHALHREYEIVMWGVLTGDYDKKLSPEKCLQKAKRYTKKGSIVVFHDSLKAMPNLQYALPRYLEHFSKQGYLFKSL